MNWLEISLTVDGELAEAVADVLGRFAPSGVVTEQGVRYRDDEDLGIGDGPIIVRAYLPADDQMPARRRRIEEALYYLGRIQPLPSPSFRAVADQNWMEAWKEHYKPIPIGKRLLVVPAWLEPDATDRIPIKIDPGMAFGTGTHPSTQLCLELLEVELERQKQSKLAGPRGLSCIDIGCGSGILAIAALKLGADLALGVDIDPAAIRNARENAEANGVGSELILGLGSVDEIASGRFAIQEAQVVAVNILAPVIIRLFAGQLATVKAPGGVIILGGLLREQESGVVEAGKSAGLRLRERRLMGDWAAISMTE